MRPEANEGMNETFNERYNRLKTIGIKYFEIRDILRMIVCFFPDGVQRNIFRSTIL